MIREQGSRPEMQVMGGRYDGAIGTIVTTEVMEDGQVVTVLRLREGGMISLVEQAADGILLRELGSPTSGE